MPRKVSALLPSSEVVLRQLGERLRLSRLRRHLSALRVAQRAGMAPMTLRSVERGGSGVTIGAYLAVMQVLGIEQDLELLAHADPVGRSLQDAQLRAPRTLALPRPPFASRPIDREPLDAVAEKRGKAAGRKRRQPAAARAWIERGHFASADALAGLIDAGAATVPKARRR